MLRYGTGMQISMALKELADLKRAGLMIPIPKGDAAGLSITNDRVDPRIPWIELDRYAFSDEDDWKAICEMADCDPEETDRVRIYIHKIESIEN